jgi:hypothetical protein
MTRIRQIIADKSFYHIKICVICVLYLLDNRDLNAAMLASKLGIFFLYNASWARPEVVYFHKLTQKP